MKKLRTFLFSAVILTLSSLTTIAQKNPAWSGEYLLESSSSTFSVLFYQMFEDEVIFTLTERKNNNKSVDVSFIAGAARAEANKAYFQKDRRYENSTVQTGCELVFTAGEKEPVIEVKPTSSCTDAAGREIPFGGLYKRKRFVEATASPVSGTKDGLIETANSHNKGIIYKNEVEAAESFMLSDLKILPDLETDIKFHDLVKSDYQRFVLAFRSEFYKKDEQNPDSVYYSSCGGDKDCSLENAVIITDNKTTFTAAIVIVDLEAGRAFINYHSNDPRWILDMPDTLKQWIKRQELQRKETITVNYKSREMFRRKTNIRSVILRWENGY